MDVKKREGGVVIAAAEEILRKHIPNCESIRVEETDGKLIAKYLLRVTYRSKKSGRLVTVTAKGHRLPLGGDDIEAIRMFVSQVPQTHSDISRKFGHIAWLEKRARQEAFLYTRSSSRVVGGDWSKDLPKYTEGASVGI